jgi:hypothetical protein
VSRKNNVNTDYYKTAGRGRPGDVALVDARKHSYKPAASGARVSIEEQLPGSRVWESVETRLAHHRRLQSRRRLKGLSAKRLSERRRRLRQAGLS